MSDRSQLEIGVLDLGFGNVGSVVNWLKQGDSVPRLISGPLDPILPLLVLVGAGNSGAFLARYLSRFGREFIEEKLNEGSKILGICLGGQILGKWNEESASEGLGLLGFSVHRLEHGYNNGWAHVAKSGESKFTYSHDFYFNHGFEMRVDEASKGTGSTLVHRIAGEKTVAAVESSNILAVQFHPEKSQFGGEKFLAELVKWVKN